MGINQPAPVQLGSKTIRAIQIRPAEIGPGRGRATKPLAPRISSTTVALTSFIAAEKLGWGQWGHGVAATMGLRNAHPDEPIQLEMDHCG